MSGDELSEDEAIERLKTEFGMEEVAEADVPDAEAAS